MKYPGALAALWLAARCSATAPIKVSMRTSWPAPDPLLELIETVALEAPTAFFPLLDALTAPTLLPAPSSLTPEALEHLVFSTAHAQGHLARPGSLQAAQMRLALHAASPKLAAYTAHYADVVGEEERCGGGAWVDWYGEAVCDLDRLVELTGHETIDEKEAGSIHANPYKRPSILPFDHVYPPPSHAPTPPPRTATLYASPFSPNFRDLHSHLLRLARQERPRLEYVFRPIPVEGAGKVNLSGYGVTLDLKKTDYLVIDDRLAGKAAPAGDSAADAEEARPGAVDLVLQALEGYPILNESVKLTDPLTEDELQQLGLQATQLIMSSAQPLAFLKQLAQDFPRYASAIARRVVVSQDIQDELATNMMRVQAGGGTHVWLNGGAVSPDSMNPFSLLTLMRKERDVVLSLQALGLSPDAAFQLLTHPAIDAPYAAGDVLDVLFDASDRPESGGLITYLNDIESDARYAAWPATVFSLFQPGPYGMPAVRLNLVNVVFVADLAQARAHYFLAASIAPLVQRGFPLRFGVVPVVDPDAPAADFETSMRVAKAVAWLQEAHEFPAATTFMKYLIQGVKSEADLEKPVNLQIARQAFDVVATTVPLLEGREARGWEEVTDITDAAARALVEKSTAYARRLDVGAGGEPFMHAFINGRHYAVDDAFMGALQADTGAFFQFFGQKVYAAELTDENVGDVGNYFYDLPGTHRRRNKHVVPSAPAEIEVFPVPSVFSGTAFGQKAGTFVYPENRRTPSTMYVIADLDTEAGLAAAQYALTFASAPDASTRLSFLHNPSLPHTDKTPDEPGAAVSAVFAHLILNERLGALSPAQLLRALKLHVPADASDAGAQTALGSDEALDQAMGGVAPGAVDARNYTLYGAASALVVRKLGLKAGDTALLVNGRVVGPFSAADFGAADFAALESYEGGKRVGPAVQALDEVYPGFAELGDEEYAALVSAVASIAADVRIPDPSEAGLYNSQLSARGTPYRKLGRAHTAFAVGAEEGAQLRFAMVLDPLSEDAQKYSALLEWVFSQPDVYAEIHLLPPPYTELPLKRFYRYNLLSQLAYDESGNEAAPISSFEDLPAEPIYTLGLDEPSAWVVRPRIAAFDLDNIQLGALPSAGAEITYELDYIAVDGHAREGGGSRPPRGVQMQLVSDRAGALADTLVMANVGYMQFRATPGAYRLEIREGRGREVYEIESAGNEGWKSRGVEEAGDVVTVTSFEGVVLYPRLARKPGMEMADVLAEEVPAKKEKEPESLVDSVVSGVFSLFGKDKDKQETGVIEKPQSRHADINIFTVASGMLYERFASIMTLSVMRNTNHTVKFWFIENFLSPSFLEFIPHLAEEYGFQYELVTYKWPKWLRAQTEKQRIIWAYKILFLDVLFPMDLDRVIFVDADQIVRADLFELVEMDLQGAPYGYTPMGDDNTDMEGFRFWKQGYWAQALQGRPYHISALYVIDLKRFRQIAAGDVLRSHYQELTADPNSLANLDQDLPNNLQRYVPIFSLHEDWLWCETWCSKDRLDRAKTIDLCQNPLTKEPKLSRARQIPEWEVYDSEIARLARRLADEGVIRESAAAADVSDLANAASGKAAPSVEDADDIENATAEERHVKHEEL